MLGAIEKFISSKLATFLRYFFMLFIGYQAFFNTQYKILPAMESQKALRVFVILVIAEIFTTFMDYRKKKIIKSE